MRQFTLRLDAIQQRPVVLLKNTLTALLDTGAYILYGQTRKKFYFVQPELMK